MKILNLYSGIGGNRKNWNNDHNITAVEWDKNIAKIYQSFFPNDKVIVADAHQYLLEHFKEFDFIWSSPPCPSHSHIRKELGVEQRGDVEPLYPDMKLYEEILFLQHFFKGRYCVENVISYYKPLIPPQEIRSHYFWTNYHIRPMEDCTRSHHAAIATLAKRKGVDLSRLRGVDKRKVLRNCVEPETGLHVFNEAFKNNQTSILGV